MSTSGVSSGSRSTADGEESDVVRHGEMQVDKVEVKGPPEVTAGKRLWEHANIRGWILDILYRPTHDGGLDDGSQASLRSLSSLVAVDMTTFQGVTERLYKRVAGFPSKPKSMDESATEEDSILPYMRAVGATQSRIQYYASKVRYICLQQAFPTLEKAKPIVLGYTYPGLKYLDVKIVADSVTCEVEATCGAMGGIDGASFKLRSASDIDSLDSNVLQCEHTGVHLAITGIEVLTSCAPDPAGILVAHLRTRMLIPTHGDFTNLDFLDLPLVRLRKAQILELTGMVPGLTYLSIMADDSDNPVDLPLLVRIAANCNKLESFSLRVYEVSQWELLSLDQSVETLCRALPNLRSLTIPYYPKFELQGCQTQHRNPFVIPAPLPSCPSLVELLLSIIPTVTSIVGGMDVVSSAIALISAQCQLHAETIHVENPLNLAGAQQLARDIHASRKAWVQWHDSMNRKTLVDNEPGWKQVPQ